MSRKEQAAREREAHAQGNPDVSIDKQKKIQEERELAQQEAEKVTDLWVKQDGGRDIMLIWTWIVLQEGDVIGFWYKNKKK